MPDFNRLPLARKSDPETSAAGAKHIRHKQSTQAMRILKQYSKDVNGLTDEQAVTLAEIHHGWKRCADLRRLGYIEKTGETRPTIAGVQAMVCRITKEGIEILKNTSAS